jgi:hypothetical protein
VIPGKDLPGDTHTTILFVSFCPNMRPTRCTHDSPKLTHSAVTSFAPPSKRSESWGQDCWRASTSGACCASSSYAPTMKGTKSFAARANEFPPVLDLVPRNARIKLTLRSLSTYSNTRMKSLALARESRLWRQFPFVGQANFLVVLHRGVALRAVLAERRSHPAPHRSHPVPHGDRAFPKSITSADLSAD